MLTVTALNKSYRSAQQQVVVLRGVDLRLAAGESVALTGESGSGKSTLLHLIAGLDRPTAGTLHIDGNDLAAMTAEQLSVHRRHNVGVIFQSFNLVSTMSALENVTLSMTFAGVPKGQR